MITQPEKEFIKYWEKNREKQKKTIRQMLVGIPLGLLFAVPIAISFFSGWHKQAALVANTPDFNPLVLLIALLIIIAFVAIFSKRHQWDMKEQQYRELLSKMDDSQDIPNEEKK